MHSHFTVVYDACVLYPATLRNVLLQLATTSLFRARWTDRIHEEWITNLLKSRPDLKPENLARTRSSMDCAIPNGLVTGYEKFIESLHLPDPDDRHVLAAAIRCNADAIVTINLKDFPSGALAPFDIEAIHPDEFVSNLDDLAPHTVRDALSTVRGRLLAPAFSSVEFLDLLKRQGLERTATKLRPHTDTL